MFKFLGASVLTAFISLFGWHFPNTPISNQPLQGINSPISISTSTMPIRGSSVLIFVDAATYNSTSTVAKINRLAQDIKNDSGARVTVYHDAYTNPMVIRNIIETFYKNSGLLGLILIGDIPTFYSTNKSFYTDRYYEELSNRCPLNSDGTFSNQEYNCGNTIDAGTYRQVFSGRIKPPTVTGTQDVPLSSAQRINLINAYLDKDHAYRTGQLSFPQKLLVFPSVDLNESNIAPTTLTSNLSSTLTRLKMYSPSQTDLINSTDLDTEKSDYSSKLSSGYETALINIHGNPNAEWFGGGAYLYSSDIQNIVPDIFYVNLLSCSNGAFEDPDYFAGWLLFSGNTLVVSANTVESYITDLLPGQTQDPVFFLGLAPLQNGAMLGEMTRRNGSGPQNQTLGDPTLRMRPLPVTGPRIVASQNVNFGNVIVGQMNKLTYTFTNSGSKILQLTRQNPVNYTVNGKNPLDPSVTAPNVLYGMGFENDPPPGQTLALSPGQSKTFDVDFEPYENGTYLGLESFYTNDPSYPYFDIWFSGIGTNATASTSNPATSTPNRWTTYSSSQYGFSFQYPANYQAKSPDSNLMKLPDKDNVVELYGSPDNILVTYASGSTLDESSAKYGTDKIYFDTTKNQWVRVTPDNTTGTIVTTAITPSYSKAGLVYFSDDTGLFESTIIPLSHNAFVIIGIADNSPEDVAILNSIADTFKLTQ